MRVDVTRFGPPVSGAVSGGVTNAGPHEALGSIGTMDPTKYHILFEDFYRYTSSDWVVTETDAAATQALTSGDGGLLLLTNTAGASDLIGMQWAGGAGSVVPTFRWEASKRLAVGVRFRTNDATNTSIAAGLYVADTTPIASAPSDGIYFLKASGGTSFVARVGKSSNYTVSSSFGTLSNNTYVELVMVYLGMPRTVDGVTYYDFLCFLNNAQVASVAATSSTAPDTADLALSFALQNAEAAAKTMTVDWIFAIKER